MMLCQEDIKESSPASPIVATPEEQQRREAARRALKQISEWKLCCPQGCQELTL